jgi:hypothetical protein
MKLSNKISVAVASLAALAVCVSTASAQNTEKRMARVTSLAGEATYSSGSSEFRPLAVGTRLSDGDVVKTGTGSHVDIDLGDNVGVLQIVPRSTLGVQTLKITRTGAEPITETQLDLREGALFAKVNKLAKGSIYEIRTPKGIAGVRGTTLFLTADGQLTVGEGMAAIAYPNNGGVDTYIVKAGETVGPNDKPPRPAPGQVLRDIVEALRDATTHGIGRDLQPFVLPAPAGVGAGAGN